MVKKKKEIKMKSDEKKELSKFLRRRFLSLPLSVWLGLACTSLTN